MNWLFTVINVIAIFMLGYVIYQQNVELAFYDSMNEAAPIVVVEAPAKTTPAETAKEPVADAVKTDTEVEDEPVTETVEEESVETTPAVDTTVESDDEIIRVEDEE